MCLFLTSMLCDQPSHPWTLLHFIGTMQSSDSLLHWTISLNYHLTTSYFLWVKASRVSQVDCIISMCNMRWSPTPGKPTYSRLTKLYLNGKPRTELVREYDLTATSLDKWIKQHQTSGSFNETDNRSVE